MIARCYSISPPFISLCLDQCRERTTFAEAAAARDTGVVAGLRAYVPEICDELASLADPLWAASDAALAAAFAELERRGLDTDGAVNACGIEYRQELEDHLDDLASVAWRKLGEQRTNQFLDLVGPVGDRLRDRLDLTAGPNWMPATRERPPR